MFAVYPKTSGQGPRVTDEVRSSPQDVFISAGRNFRLCVRTTCVTAWSVKAAEAGTMTSV